MFLIDLFFRYWSVPVMETNFIIFLNLLGAFILGIMLGAERAYQGRAAGMRTYGLVCMSSCALTVFSGFSHFWWGGSFASVTTPDPTRVIQGIVTGIGFLGAGVIMKDGFSISGLSTAASIWMCSAIGVLVGVGFYGAAITLTILAILGMILIPKFENLLPQKHAIVIRILFKKSYSPDENYITQKALERGYTIPKNSISIISKNGLQEWNFVALAIPGKESDSLTKLALDLNKFDGIEDFSVSPSRH
jgi:putative Mg2+ transporter-C (MgtC) family protein